VKRTWLTALVLLLAGCGIQPSGVTDAGQAPTGLASGVTLYYVDAHNRLSPQFRKTDRLETISDAISLLLTGPGLDSPLQTEIAPVPAGIPRGTVTTAPGLIQLDAPFTIHDVTPLGIDQIVCTALAAYVQAGGPKSTKVQVKFTLPTPESSKRRTCPLIR
jgi:hypothetical protein